MDEYNKKNGRAEYFRSGREKTARVAAKIGRVKYFRSGREKTAIVAVRKPRAWLRNGRIRGIQENEKTAGLGEFKRMRKRPD